MLKIYGYKEKDVLGLAEFIIKGNYKNLSQAFSDYANVSGKAKGTIRNLYYALARKSREDKEFANKYLGGEVFKVNSIVAFSDNEERQLIDTILKLTSDGRSVRSAIFELSKGDNKLALRYQNKFRNVVKHNPEILNQTKESANQRLETKVCVSEAQLSKLKSEINSLVNKIALSVKRENQRLLNRITVLEKQNKSLKAKLSSASDGQRVARFFVKNDTGALLS